MDNLDVGGSLSFPWMPYGASQFSECQVNGDFGFLSQRSSMLEPIIEETSDDDDVSCGHVWTHSDSPWSSESDTGSVIRVELVPGKPIIFYQNKPTASYSKLFKFWVFKMVISLIELYANYMETSNQR